jgi:hypothetical protein
MKKTPSQKPLRLDRTTVKRLDDASLPAIAGARPPDTRTCFSCISDCSCPTL